MRTCRLLTTVVALLALASFVAQDADAKPRRKPKRKPGAAAAAAKAPAANTRAVSELMGQFKWGMNEDEVLGVLGAQIDAKYAEQIKATTDVLRQDGLRKKAAAEKKKIKSEAVKFDGKKTGWDVSIVNTEFGHNNDESMLVYWESDPSTNKDQRRFFFFHEGKLWKMFIAFNSELFQGKTFVDFSRIMEDRYGKGAPGSGESPFLFWRSGEYYLRAIDLTKFYGNFCVAISNDEVERTIYERRAERNPKGASGSTIVEAVTEGDKDDSKPSLNDPNADVIDRLTGGK